MANSGGLTTAASTVESYARATIAATAAHGTPCRIRQVFARPGRQARTEIGPMCQLKNLLVAAGLILGAGACGSSSGDGVDAGPGDSCTGTESRCFGTPCRRAAIGEAQAHLVAARAGDRAQRLRVGRRPPASERDGVGLQGADPAPQPRRQHLLELGQSAQRGLLDAGHAAAGRGAQADRHGDRLVVVEQQRRQVCARPEPVAAGRAGRGVDGIAEPAQAIDVVAHGAGRDLETVRQLGPVQRGRAWSSERSCRSRAEVSSIDVAGSHDDEERTVPQ